MCGDAILPGALPGWGTAESAASDHNRGGVQQIAETTEADPLLVHLRRISEQLLRIEHKLDEVIRRGTALGLRHELTQMTRELDDIE